MKAQDIADLIHAERVGKTRWVSNCPAHKDEDFQLTITDVPGCAGLVECGARCSRQRIARCMGISWDDLDSKPAAQPNLLELEDDAMVLRLRQERKREINHQIVCARIRRGRRQLDWLERLEANAKNQGGANADPAAQEVRAEMKQLRALERKWRG